PGQCGSKPKGDLAAAGGLADALAGRLGRLLNRVDPAGEDFLEQPLALTVALTISAARGGGLAGAGRRGTCAWRSERWPPRRAAACSGAWGGGRTGSPNPLGPDVDVGAGSVGRS